MERPIIKCPECGCTTDFNEFPERSVDELEHWKDCNILLGEDETIDHDK